MRRMVSRRVEDAVASQILRGQAKAGDIIALDVADVSGEANSTNPQPAPPPAPTQPTSGVLYERPKDDLDQIPK